MNRMLGLVLLSLSVACSAHAGSKDARAAAAPQAEPAPLAPAVGPVSKEELARVRKRAEYIYNSERASIRASDLLVERKDLDTSKLQRFLTVPREGFWYAMFGRFTEDGKFVPAYAYRAPLLEPDHMEAFSVESLPGDFSPAARAAKMACEAAAKVHQRGQVNPIVLEEEKQLTVYVMQGSHVAGVTVLGGDFRFHFSKDGRQILEQTPLHQGLIGVDVRVRHDEFAGAFHTHVLFPGPLETELAMLMLFPEMRVLFVGDPRTGFVYKLLPDGSIETLSLEELKKRQAMPDPLKSPGDIQL